MRIIDNPSEWIITKRGDFVRIKDSEIQVEKKLEAIREHLKKPYKGIIRFQAKTPEQIAKERYDKVLEEVGFDYEKLHDWIYDEKNKDKIEIIKLEGQDFSEAVEVIFNSIKKTKQKWRQRSSERKDGWGTRATLVNEETGQVIYSSSLLKEKISDLIRTDWKEGSLRGTGSLIKLEEQRGTWKNNTSTVIFLHGTYGAINDFRKMEKKFPNTKFIYPSSPTLQYDMWHGANEAPGEQCKGWINITGDAHELMDTDVCPNNPPPKKNFAEADKVIHLDYHQLMRAVAYVNEIIETEIAAGIPPEKIFISGYSQGGLLTLAVALTSPHKLGGFIPLCGLLPCWDKLLVRPSDKNKKTPCLIINNSKDPWVPFWTGKKSYDLLKERGYNVEFKTLPGRGHGWENEDVEEFLEKCLSKKEEIPNFVKEYFKKNDIHSVELKDNGNIEITYNKEGNGTERSELIQIKESGDISKGFPELHWIKEYLKRNNKKVLYSELVKYNQSNTPLVYNNKTKYWPWIIGIIIVILLLVIFIKLVLRKKKSPNKQQN